MIKKISSTALALSSFFSASSFNNADYSFLDNDLFLENPSTSKKRHPHKFSGVAKQKRLAKKRKSRR
tara:strand:- start:71 stop:271 length:201 start_codon:yes stop_codon:yes gene_type:complete